MTRCSSRAGRSRWAPAARRWASSTTTRSCRPTSSCRSTCTCPAAPRAPRRCCTASCACARRSTAPSARAGGSATTRWAPRKSFPTGPAPATPRSTSSPVGTPQVPDAVGLEETAHVLRDRNAESVLGTDFGRGERAVLLVNPAHVIDVLTTLKDQGYSFLASLHGVDYYPEEPRLGVLYELLDMKAVDRISVKARVRIDDPHVPTVTTLWPGADFPERECFDMFGVIFDGHADLRRILMPEDYEGHPQRRDFPVGGEPVLFTY